MGEIDGLPTHVLLVHAVVVLTPLAALCVVLAALWPAARARLGPLPLGLAALVTALVPLTVQAGEWLQRRLPANDRIRRHAGLGDDLLPWVLGLLAVAAALWWLGGASGLRQNGPSRLGDRRVRLVVGLLAVVVATGATVMTYRIGESGARAVWEGVGQG